MKDSNNFSKQNIDDLHLAVSSNFSSELRETEKETWKYGPKKEFIVKSITPFYRGTDEERKQKATNKLTKIYKNLKSNEQKEEFLTKLGVDKNQPDIHKAFENLVENQFKESTAKKEDFKDFFLAKLAEFDEGKTG